jgi:hypothetical protein
VSLADRLLGPAVPATELPYPVPDGVTVRRSRLIPALGGWFMGGSRAPAGAVTFGRTILFNAELPITDDLLVHELVHVEQWKDPLFLVKYVAGWLRHGYRRNPFEEEAYAAQRRHAQARTPSAPPKRT